MRKLSILLTAVVLVFTACQKEVSLENPDATPGIPGNTNGTQLVRTGHRLGSDTLTVNYTYNASNNLTGVSFAGTFQGSPFVLQEKINRNSANIITSVVIKSPVLPILGFGSDSLVTQYTYDAASGRYISGKTVFLLDSMALVDSTVFAYNNVGKLSDKTTYFGDGNTGYFPALKTEYRFAENNLVETKFYSYSDNKFELEETTALQHDAKVNPLSVPSEAPLLVFGNVYQLRLSDFFNLLGLNDFFSVNNISKISVTDVATSDTEEIDFSYTYNTTNRPTDGVRSFGGAPFAVSTFTYQ